MDKSNLPDALSAVLETLNLSTVVYCRAEMSAPWGLRFARREVATFHAVRSGVCWLRHDGAAQPLVGGDFVVFPHGAAHELVDSPRRAAEPIESVLERRGGGGTLVHGGGGAPVLLLCGHFCFERSPVHPLLSLLPPVIVVKGADGRAAPRLEAALELLGHETARESPGSSLVIRWATHILLVQLIRAYLESSGDNLGGWLRGLRDGPVASALVAIHQNPERDWSVSSLARLAGQSRSVFCGRFAKLVGESPHRYLTRWRIFRATQLIQDGKLAFKEIAQRTGFKDEVTFSKAFKRHLGVPPAAYRKNLSVDPLRDGGAIRNEAVTTAT